MKTKNSKKSASSAKKTAQKKSKKQKKQVADYVVRLNEQLTVAQINKVLDAIDKNNGYCPCQIQSKDTKCHCKDFKENKELGEPCICKIYTKKEKPTAGDVK